MYLTFEISYPSALNAFGLNMWKQCLNCRNVNSFRRRHGSFVFIVAFGLRKTVDSSPENLMGVTPFIALLENSFGHGSPPAPR